MGLKIKKIIFERIKRIMFIKTELNRLVGKSMFKNTNNKDVQSLITKDNSNYKQSILKSISSFRFYCYIDRSSKLVNKKFRLSRFALNREAKKGNIPNFIKKGW